MRGSAKESNVYSAIFPGSSLPECKDCDDEQMELLLFGSED